VSDAQQFNAALVHFISRFGVFVQLAILVIAIVAARRHRLSGLWLLAAAAAVMTLHSIANLVLSPSLIASNDRVMTFWISLQYVPFFAALVALCGWCVLAFSRARGEKPKA
jgi:hypothetical protein